MQAYPDWTPHYTETATCPLILKVDMATAFISAVFANYEAGWINLRCLKKHDGDRPKFGKLNTRTNTWIWEHWFPLVETVADPSHLIGVAFAAECYGYNVYVGALPRGRHGEARKSSIYMAGVAWAELDFDKQGGEAETLRKAEATHPDVLVHSGGGLHLYWLLKSPIPMTAETARLFEMALKSRQQKLGADAVHDITRILRLPCTGNYKYDPPRPVVLLRCPSNEGEINKWL